MDGRVQNVLDKGARSFLQKPLRSADLLRMVTEQERVCLEPEAHPVSRSLRPDLQISDVRAVEEVPIAARSQISRDRHQPPPKPEVVDRELCRALPLGGADRIAEPEVMPDRAGQSERVPRVRFRQRRAVHESVDLHSRPKRPLRGAHSKPRLVRAVKIQAQLIEELAEGNAAEGRHDAVVDADLLLELEHPLPQERAQHGVACRHRHAEVAGAGQVVGPTAGQWVQ